ncbi:MAG: glycyl-radical enzyme activating protein [Dehalococcoidia bacterium]|nr:glycyl-radical enzyme activating protein [Dehalococcoidia bacterium]
MEEQVLVTNIQRFAVNDGPGFRTNVFLKGCPLRCTWCHNPETIAAYPELYWKKRLCVQCGACMEACPRDAINAPIPPEESQREESTYFKIVRERCDLCMRCVEACRHDALEIVGKPMTVEEILDEVERDTPFYSNSGGGMTLSGGEPALHARFASDLLEQARKRGLHNCLDTCGHCSWEVLQRLLENTDIVL